MTNTETGEILVEKKFHKPKFNEIMNNPEYKSYVDGLLERAMIKKMNNTEFDIDAESYEEIRSIALEAEI